MPNSYTAPIYEGKDISVGEFAARCARALGYTIHQREDSFGSPLRYRTGEFSGDYHTKSLKEANDRLSEWESLSEEDKYGRWSDYVYEQDLRRAESKAKDSALRARYMDMIAKVTAIKVEPIMESTKEFMLETLHNSMDFDCIDPNSKFTDEYYKTLGYVEFCNIQLKNILSDIEYHSKHIKQEQERIEQTNNYLKALGEAFDIDIL